MKKEFNALSDTTMSKLLDIYQMRDWGNNSWNEFIDLFLEDFEQTVKLEIILRNKIKNLKKLLTNN